MPELSIETASVHARRDGVHGGYSGVRTENTQSGKICLNFHSGGGGVRTENTQSGKICLNFNGGGEVLWSQN